MSSPATSPVAPALARRRFLQAGAVGLGALAVESLGGRAEAATVTASAFPAPGSHAASPSSELTFRGVTTAQLSRLVVTGSSSGGHGFRLAAHSDGHGASALLVRPLVAGETVTVSHGLPLAKTSGGSHTFRVATPVSFSGKPLPGGTVSPPAWKFASEPSLRPPRNTTEVLKPGTDAGYLLTAPYGAGSPGPLLTTSGGEVVWFRPITGGVATAAVVQSYQGRDVLTWWEGKGVLPGLGMGEYVMVDSAYRQVARFGAGNGYAGDLHEMRITPQGTALITIYAAVQVDLSSLGGPRNGSVFDGIVQEIDIPTGRVLWEWHALDHIDVSETYFDIPKSSKVFLDYVHPNCASMDGDAVLISLRSTHSAVRVSHATGDVVWRLGGKRSTYRMASNATFHSQHNVLRTSDGRISLFDNGAGVGGNTHRTSRGLVLKLDDHAKTATVSQELLPPDNRLAVSQGSMQLLPNGHALVGWGAAGAFTEYDGKGAVLYDVELPPGLNTYRAYRQAWKGSPYYAPRAAVNRTSGGVAVHMSWNGSTDTAAWAVLSGSSVTHLRVLTTVQRTGFETSVDVAQSSGVIVVRALDSGGRTLGTSRSVTI